MPLYALPPSILIQEVGGETVVLHMEKGEYFELNEMGTVMLKRLRECADLDQIVDSLTEEYAVSQTEASEDLQRLILSLESYGLVQKVNGSSP